MYKQSFNTRAKPGFISASLYNISVETNVILARRLNTFDLLDGKCACDFSFFRLLKTTVSRHK